MLTTKRVPAEVLRLHKLGFAIHWLRPRSKIPLNSGWTKGPRLDIEELTSTWKPGFNPGVRLGSASKVADGYLAVVDVDVKSTDIDAQTEAITMLYSLYPQLKDAPYLLSGRGYGSAHYYVRLKEPVRGKELKARSKDVVKVHMPSVGPSAYEREKLTSEELNNGLRLRPAWEITLLSEGRQAAIVGAIHPDSGKPYTWGKAVNGSGLDIPLIDPEPETTLNGVKPKCEGLPGSRSVTPARRLKIEDVDAETLGLRDEQVRAIIDGGGVSDRSASIFGLCMAMLQRKIPESQILGVFTRSDYYLGQAAFEHAKTTDRDRAAIWVNKYCLAKAKEQVAASNQVFDIVEVDDRSDVEPLEEPLPPSWQLELPVGVTSGSDWQRDLVAQKGKDRVVRIRCTSDNLQKVIKGYAGQCLSFDSFVLKTFWVKDTPWGNTIGQERSGDNDDAIRFKTWFINIFHVEPALTLINEAFRAVELENVRHSLREYLDGLKWDGVERVETAFKVYLNAKMPEPYLPEVSRKFFAACVRRAYEPGCKFDHTIVLEGKQDLGKSTFIEILASKKWFLDGLPNFADKDAAVNLQGTWICELGELSTLYRSTNDATKAFIARNVDRYRPPYGHRRQDFPRTTVFVGSTNDKDYLTDKTGNRRWWPIQVGQCQFKDLIRDRDQLWAEAVFNYHFDPEKLWLEGKAKGQAQTIQESRVADDEADLMLERFYTWLDARIENGEDVKRLSLSQLFNSDPFATFNQTATNTKRAAWVLRRAGYKRKHTHKGKVWVAK